MASSRVALVLGVEATLLRNCIGIRTEQEDEGEVGDKDKGRVSI